jgi:hypothetical protein
MWIHVDPYPVSETLVHHVLASRAISLLFVSMRIRIPYPKRWDCLHSPRANSTALHSTIKHTHTQRPDMKTLIVHALRNVYVKASA